MLLPRTIKIFWRWLVCSWKFVTYAFRSLYVLTVNGILVANSCIQRYVLHVTWFFRVLFSFLTLFDYMMPARNLLDQNIKLSISNWIPLERMGVEELESSGLSPFERAKLVSWAASVSSAARRICKNTNNDIILLNNPLRIIFSSRALQGMKFIPLKMKTQLWQHHLCCD